MPTTLTAGSTAQSEQEEPEASPDTKCVFIIFNPVSGTEKPEARKKAITDAMAAHGYTCQFTATTKKKGAQALAEKAIKDGVDLIAVSGGDGTVVEAMCALVGSDIPLAVLPAGTGNLLSVNLGIPIAIEKAVEAALGGNVYELDMARYGDKQYFAIMGGLGLDAQMIHDADRKAKSEFGVFAYLVAALKNLYRPSATVRVQLDDKPPLVRKAKCVLVANMGKITGGLEAIPTACPDDGLLDVAILAPETLGQWLRLIGYAIAGRTQDDPKLDVIQARKIKITTISPQAIEFDGEDGGQTKDVTIEIVPKAVRVLLPKNAPAAKAVQEPPHIAARKAGARRLVLIPAAVIAGGALAFWAVRRKRNNGA